ncbi:MAG: hypothetical protein AUK34_02185 [Ignavibacteria bacterium CG2_30_36_16]|nr:hypothetical protein [Ignavibacteria bacterium]OIP63157.1 MAG: hypothetical protein AUK34_02185 [Ignavibacteria bacterium CG2_30_36_16]
MRIILFKRGLWTPILFFILLFFQISFAEDANTTIKKINEKIDIIKKASRLFNIDYRILCSIIYSERTLNFNWEDEALDIIIAKSGLNSSIGFCQIKIKTAYWIENQLSDITSVYYPGNNYQRIISISESKIEIIKKLENDTINILYAAAYLRIIISRWMKEDIFISDRPDILGTLYSSGLFYSDGSERFPNNKPKSNHFGKRVIEIYKKLY